MRLAVTSFVIIILIQFVPLLGQILICKNVKGKAGLILPAIAFIMSIIKAINVDGSGGGWWIAAVLTFLTANITTLIYYLIYSYYDRKGKQKDELDKMEIMDM